MSRAANRPPKGARLRKTVVISAIMFAVALVLFIVFMLPFFLILINAGKTSSEITLDPLALPQGFSQLLENIKTIWNNQNVRYASSFMSSVIITVASVTLIIISTSMAAWVLVRTKSKLSTGIFMMFVAAMVIPFQVVMFPLVEWFRRVSDFTAVILPFTENGLRLTFTHGGLIFAYMGFGASLSIFFYHGFIKGIPVELEEAAYIDGCSRPAIFFRIIFPLLTPITVTVLILNALWIWNDYLLPLIILGANNRVMTLPLAVQNFVGTFGKQWDLLLTSALLAMIPIIVVYLFCQKYIIKGMTDGAIK